MFKSHILFHLTVFNHSLGKENGSILNLINCYKRCIVVQYLIFPSILPTFFLHILHLNILQVKILFTFLFNVGG